MEGAKSPKHSGKKCSGENLTGTQRLDSLNLEWLVKAYNNTSDKSKFFNSFFTKLVGTEKLQQQIEMGISSEEIKASWQKGLEEFKAKRENYLLYR